MGYWGFFGKGKLKMSKKPSEKLVRLATTVYEAAMCAKRDTLEGCQMDECSWLSYLIERGLKNIERWKESWR